MYTYKLFMQARNLGNKISRGAGFGAALVFTHLKSNIMSLGAIKRFFFIFFDLDLYLYYME